MTAPPRYRLAPHTADLAVEVAGADLAALLANLAWAVADQYADAAAVAPRVAVPLALAAPDREALVVALANELIYRRDAEGLVLPHLEVAAADGGRLEATARGEPADPARHALRPGLKAATWHGLSVRDTPGGGLEAFVVFDV